MLGAFCKAEKVCTLAVYFRMFEDFPLIIAANRDEHYDRPSAAPSLLADNAKNHQRAEISVPAAHGWALMRRSRWSVSSIAIRSADFPCCRRAFSRLALHGLARCRTRALSRRSFHRDHRVRYNPFTLLFADKNDAFVSHNAKTKIITQKLPAGLHVFSSAAEFELAFGEGRARLRAFRRRENHGAAWAWRSQRRRHRIARRVGGSFARSGLRKPRGCHLRSSR